MPKTRNDEPPNQSADRPTKKISAFFFHEESGNEPVKGALLKLTKAERQQVAIDIRTAEYGWPIGMPTCRALGRGLHEIRTNLPTRIFRILFRVDDDGRMILLHGFVKKTQATPQQDIDLAETRWRKYLEG